MNKGVFRICDMHQETAQTSDGGRLRLVCCRVDGFQARALTLLTQHILDRVDFSAVKATPSGRTATEQCKSFQTVT